MIGIVGATGGVGRAAVAALRRLDNVDIRLGGRRRQALDELARSHPGTRVTPVDLLDADELAGFCGGCDVVLNCAGPAYEVGDRVARAAMTAGADYVDAAGDDALYHQVAHVSRERPAATAMVSAGMMPGLTALLPRYLARVTTGAPRALTGYVGGRDRFTVTAAADYVRGGASFGTARVAWRDGRRVPASAQDGTPPFFPEPAGTMAFWSTEVERVCTGLGITSADWYSVFTGEHVSAAIRGPSTPEALAHAAALDSFGRRRYQLIVLELVTCAQTKTLVLRGPGASELTGEFAALSAHEVARGRVPAGVHHAGEILDPAEAVARLQVDQLTVLDGSARETGSYVEEAV